MAMSDQMKLPDLPDVKLPEERWDSWLLSRMGSALDQVILRGMQVIMMDNMAPDAAEMPAIQAAIEPYLSGELWDNPRQFFSFVDAPVAPLDVTGEFRRFIKGDVVMAREFTSAYRPYRFADGRWADRPPSKPDDKVLVEHWMREPGRARATVLAVHGFSSGNPRIDAFMLFASQLFDHGLDVALLTLPYHGARTPPNARFSGEGFGMPHVAGVNEAVRQAIYEIHMVGGWLRQQTGAPVGLLGMSLGGYLSALMVGLTSDWDFVIPMVPPVCMGDMAWRFYTRSRRFGPGKPPPFTREQLRAIYRVHSPLTYPLQIDKDRAFILAGRGDQFVPAEHPNALWLHWGKPEIFWFTGSHVAPIQRGRVISRVLAHLDRPVSRGKRTPRLAVPE